MKLKKQAVDAKSGVFKIWEMGLCWGVEIKSEFTLVYENNREEITAKISIYREKDILHRQHRQ